MLACPVLPVLQRSSREMGVREGRISRSQRARSCAVCGSKNEETVFQRRWKARAETRECSLTSKHALWCMCDTCIQHTDTHRHRHTHTMEKKLYKWGFSSLSPSKHIRNPTVLWNVLRPGNSFAALAGVALKTECVLSLFFFS